MDLAEWLTCSPQASISSSPFPLKQILALVGNLDDAPEEDNPRERFRLYLKEDVNEVGQIRDHVEESLRTTGSQYNRAFRDLINYLGHFLEFEVKFGRCQAFRGR